MIGYILSFRFFIIGVLCNQPPFVSNIEPLSAQGISFPFLENRLVKLLLPLCLHRNSNSSVYMEDEKRTGGMIVCSYVVATNLHVGFFFMHAIISSSIWTVMKG